ncbi:hypothetical protein TVAG_228660 [Trichomonas vaginalis G3]|uniref:Uncharacterized protein n=1 Tax=Trichomonas vaginalis (strain ATCC PRA-98 / G3) TaxID=412133 RepID=A2DJ28_TRIV3|nr:hypothetical protein TVAGG3_0470780 [Trichomonas vaginalis G3]EAY19603.1 hypothetical protein TVAG_228660 [Trichomonas vaginalis G3]KAI5515043.1 hypothetical protein TVAGG3_0470780 [Trichomonas vaginalis G3]|eukprot:XP_001580589.1 hypothetical protein [Trichomonas vaginalis G3]
MVGFILPSIIRVVLSKYIGEYRNTVHLSFAPMIYNIFFILPLSGANWFGSIFYKSLRGYGGHLSLLISFILSSLMVFVCKISGRIGKRIKINQRTDTSILIERPRQELCRFSYREIISIFCYVIVGYLVGQDILRCAYEYYLLNMPLDVHFIIDRVIIFIFASSTIAGIRTFIIYKYDIPASWMSGNVTQNFLLALTVGMREVVRLFVDLLYNYHFEASVYYATCVMSTIGLVIGIGAGFSLIISFIITFAVFNRDDVQVLETE